MCTPSIDKYGASPAFIKWTAVRGDTATLEVAFLDDDEVTEWDTTGWTVSATSYDPVADTLDELIATISDNVVTIIAPASLTTFWGEKYQSVVAELKFDLQVTIPEVGEDTVWTPVIGTICVIGNVTPGGL
jgi:hypothetical protein